MQLSRALRLLSDSTSYQGHYGVEVFSIITSLAFE